MTCATCAVRIERVLGRQEGVEAASVNLAGASAMVRIDDRVDVDALQGAVAAGILMLTGSLNTFGTWMLENIPALGQVEQLFTPKELQKEILKEGAR